LRYFACLIYGSESVPFLRLFTQKGWSGVHTISSIAGELILITSLFSNSLFSTTGLNLFLKVKTSSQISTSSIFL
jgi:hypothetical protein